MPPLPPTCTLHRVIISFSLFCFYNVDISLRAPPICKIDWPHRGTAPRRPCTCLFRVPLIYVRESGLDRRFVFPLQLSFVFQKKARALTQVLGYSLLQGVNCDNASRLQRIPAPVSGVAGVAGDRRCVFVLRGRCAVL